MPIEILPQGAKIPAQAFQLKRPEYTAMLPFWQFWRHSHELTGGYEANTQTYTTATEGATDYSFDETYLVPHEKEDSTDFSRRVAQATPPRFVQEGISYITGVLTQQAPNRDSYPEKIETWMSRVNAEGQTWQQWIAAEVVPMVERYQHVYTLHTRPDIAGESAGEQTAAREAAGLPEVVCSIIIPENLPWWETDDAGRLVAVRYTESTVMLKEESGFPVREEAYTLHWWLTLEGWMNAVETAGGTGLSTGVVLESGFWNGPGKPMQTLPVVKWELNGPCPTETASLAQLKFFRIESILTHLEYATCFPMTWIPVESSDENPAETVKGPDIVGGYPADGQHEPLLLEPRGTSIQHLVEKRLPQLETDSLTPYGRQREVGGNDSGVALAHIKETSMNIHRDHAMAFGGAEFDALQPVAELLGEELDDDARVEWPQDFGALDDLKQTEVLTAFLEAEPGPVYEQKAVDALARVALPRLSESEYEEGNKAFEEQQKEAKEQAAENDDLEDGAFGGPAALNPVQVGGGENEPNKTPRME